MVGLTRTTGEQSWDCRVRLAAPIPHDGAASRTLQEALDTGHTEARRPIAFSVLSVNSVKAFACQLLLALSAIVDQPGEFAAEVLAVDDEIHEAFVLEKLGALEALGEFDLDRVPDRARAGEA